MFEPENDIERALMRATSEPDERPGFLRALIDAEIFVALIPEGGPIVAGPDGKATIPEGTTLKLASVVQNDEKHLAFFTAPSRARVWCKGDHIVAPEKTRDLFGRAPDMPYLLNPGSDFGKTFASAEVRRLLKGGFGDGGHTLEIEEPEELLLGMPEDRPDALIAALARELGALKTVQGAWLMLVARAGESEQNWMLGVEHNGAWRDVQGALNRAVRGDILDGRFLDAVPVTASSVSLHLRTGIPVMAAKRGFFSKLFR